MSKKIYRKQSDKMVAGICSGLAEYLDIDPTLIRLIFVGVGLLTALFPMFFFYIIAWIIIPVKEEVITVRKKQDPK